MALTKWGRKVQDVQKGIECLAAPYNVSWAPVGYDDRMTITDVGSGRTISTRVPDESYELGADYLYGRVFLPLRGLLERKKDG
jgi:hypothetical protein